MTTGRMGCFAASLVCGLASLALCAADRALAQTVPLNVVYGPGALSREGDVDYSEHLFISVPEGFAETLFLRVFDPEAAGEHDTPYGSFVNSTTMFRLLGGDGAYTNFPLSQPVADGAAANPADASAMPEDAGTVIAEQRFGSEEASDNRWIALTPLRASQGEILEGRAYFRLDVIGEAGDDGNVFAFEVSLSPDDSEAAEDVRTFAYRPTLRWPATPEGVELRFEAPAGQQVTLQNFDSAFASLDLVSSYSGEPLNVSGQDVWASDEFIVPEGRTAIEFRGGDETPNDATFSLYDPDRRPLAFELPARLLPPAQRPTPVAVATPLADCKAVAFDASGSAGDGPLQTHWLFGDGNASEAPVVVHRYDNPGTYDAELRILGISDRVGDGSSIRVPVHIRNRPTAVAGEPTVAAPGDEILFDGSGSVPSDRPIESFLWSFGDGSQASGAVARKRFDSPGLYHSILRVADGADHPCNFGVAQRLVTINFPPVAEAGEGRDAAIGQTVRFDGSASYDIDGEIGQWRWDFGDGASGNEPAVDHVYQIPGIYTARLTVTDDAGVANSTASDIVRIGVNAPPVPTSTRPDRPIAVGEVARFDATESSDLDGEILSYFWEFGDGAIGEGDRVEYAYAAPGIYQVRLTLRDNSATLSDTAETAFSVVVSAAPIAASGPDQFVTASEVVFDGGGSSDPDGEITTYEWTFGDGEVGTGRIVRHAYREPGIYEVSLNVRDDSGAPLNIDRDTASVRINQTPIADAGPDLIVAPGQESVLDGSGSVDPDGTIDDYLWRFEDGSEARGRQVTRSFDIPGRYRVELIVRDDSGHEAAFDVDEVLVAVNAPPVANAGPDVLVEPGTELRVSSTASFDPDGTIRVFRWDFDDLATPVFGEAPTRVFDQPGVYTAQLTVIDDSGTINASTSDEIRIHVNHAPIAEAGPDIRTDRLIVTLDGSGSVDADGDALIFSWDPGDGSAALTGRTVTHTYPRSGIYPVSLTVDDGSLLDNARAVDPTRVIIDSRPIAVAGGNRDVCSGESILFDASASSDPDGGLLRYEWDFGDNTSAAIVNPAKTYEQPGVYPVTLTVRDETGTDNGIHRDRIAAIIREAPIARAGAPVKACTNQTIRFDGSLSTDADGAVNLFSWSFGDGSTGGGERPTHLYDRPGEYRVILTITGESSGICNPLDTDETTVTVFEAPRVSIDGPVRVATGVPVTFQAVTSFVEGAGQGSFEWGLPNDLTATGTTVTHSFVEPGEYEVLLTANFAGGEGDCGAIGSRLRVVANAPPVADAGGPRMVALGEELLFDASASNDPDGAITRYAWDFGDGAEASGVQARHRYTEPGIYRLALTVTDDAGVENSASTATVEISVNPTALASLQAPWPLCAGSSHNWVAAANNGVSAVWQFGDGTELTGSSVDHAFAEPGLYAVAVTLDDKLGLANSVRTETVFARVNRSPEAEAGPDRLACPGDLLTFDAAGSVDHDGKLSRSTWSFDDGVSLDGWEVERSFETPGSYRATLTVADETGAACGMAADTARIRINAAPLVDAGPEIEGPIGAAHDVFIFDASAARDPDGDGVTIVWDFGDGTRRAGAVVKHRYATPGDYTVTVEAQDSSGLACGSATDTTAVRARARF